MPPEITAPLRTTCAPLPEAKIVPVSLPALTTVRPPMKPAPAIVLLTLLKIAPGVAATIRLVPIGDSDTLPPPLSHRTGDRERRKIAAPQRRDQAAIGDPAGELKCAAVIDLDQRARRYCRIAEQTVDDIDLTARQGLQLAARDRGTATKFNVRATARSWALNSFFHSILSASGAAGKRIWRRRYLTPNSVGFGRYSPQANRHGENEHWSPILGRRLCDRRQPRRCLRRAVAASPNSTALGRAASSWRASSIPFAPVAS